MERLVWVQKLRLTGDLIIVQFPLGVSHGWSWCFATNPCGKADFVRQGYFGAAWRRTFVALEPDDDDQEERPMGHQLVARGSKPHQYHNVRRRRRRMDENNYRYDIAHLFETHW